MRRLVGILVPLLGTVGALLVNFPQAGASPTLVLEAPQLAPEPARRAPEVAFDQQGHRVEAQVSPGRGLAGNVEIGQAGDAALREQAADHASPRRSYPASEVAMLARAIYAEARGEPYVGQVAVGAVILNRVEHPRFPDTIAGVVYQPGAFTAVYDGQINLQPDETAWRAAEDALAGWDPSGGALYYWNPAKARSKWIWSRPIITEIGRHVFAR